MKQYRDNGAIGALLDEYEKANTELITLLNEVSEEELVAIADPTTDDEDCRSIQTILTHVVRAGYNYAINTRNYMGENLPYAERVMLDSVAAYQDALAVMFRYNEQLFDDYPDIKLEEADPAKKMIFSWGQTYDVEQIYEHAIVHILRHRRQIERFLIRLRG